MKFRKWMLSLRPGDTVTDHAGRPRRIVEIFDVMCPKIHPLIYKLCYSNWVDWNKGDAFIRNLERTRTAEGRMEVSDRTLLLDDGNRTTATMIHAFAYRRTECTK